MDIFKESEHICSSKSRLYFEEVIRSYSIGNYRSAIVMLYSICLCDLVFKLHELNDLYKDKTAQKILESINNLKQKSESKSSWEKELVDSIYKNTQLLDLQAYTHLNHLYDYRNLSAHPALDRNGELISPPKEIVAAYIRTSLETILLKPAIFIKDITEYLSEDLSEKKEYITADKDQFKKYLDSKYLSKMNDVIFVRVFQSFWKFTFFLSNPECNSNRHINGLLLGIMLEEREHIIIEDIKNNSIKYEVRNLPEITDDYIHFLSQFPSIYKHLEEHIRTLTQTICNEKQEYALISWFLSNSKKEHIEQLISNNKYIFTTSSDYILYFYKEYIYEGLKDICLNYLIATVDHAQSYIDAGERIEYYIMPFLQDMNKNQFEVIFSLFDSCAQIKHNYHRGSYAKKIWEVTSPHFGGEIDPNTYPMFYEVVGLQPEG